MQRVKIKDVIEFIRTYDKQGAFRKFTGNRLRSYVHFGLKNTHLYVCVKKSKIVGMIEYYRFKTFIELSRAVARKLRFSTPTEGKIIWIRDALFAPPINKDSLKQFIAELKDFDNIYWWKLKRNKIILCKLRQV